MAIYAAWNVMSMNPLKNLLMTIINDVKLQTPGYESLRYACKWKADQSQGSGSNHQYHPHFPINWPTTDQYTNYPEVSRRCCETPFAHWKSTELTISMTKLMDPMYLKRHWTPFIFQCRICRRRSSFQHSNWLPPLLLFSLHPSTASVVENLLELYELSISILR